MSGFKVVLFCVSILILKTPQFISGYTCNVNYFIGGTCEVYCDFIPLTSKEIFQGPNGLSFNLTHLFVSCGNALINNNTSLDQFHSLLVSLSSLLYLQISNCLEFSHVPTNLFHNLNSLAVLSLDKLPLKKLPIYLFENSRLIRELRIVDIPLLSEFDPSSSSTAQHNQLSKIHLQNTAISASNLLRFLSTNYQTLKTLILINNTMTNLYFDEHLFSYFNFDFVTLQQNRLNNPIFLKNLHSINLDLSRNLFDKKFHLFDYLPIFETTKTLSLSYNRLIGCFPANEYHNRSSVLIDINLSHNFINSLHKMFHIIFPFLKHLDLSFNGFKLLPNSLQRIQLNSLSYRGNDFYCSCQMNWILNNSNLFNNMICRNNSDNKIVKFTEVNRPIKCEAPKIYLEYLNNIKTPVYNEKISVCLYKCEYIQFQINIVSDPHSFISIDSNIYPYSRQTFDHVVALNPFVIHNSQLSEEFKTTNYLNFYVNNQIDNNSLQLTFIRHTSLRTFSDRLFSNIPYSAIKFSAKCNSISLSISKVLILSLSIYVFFNL